MDNITHSLTGALTAKLVTTTTSNQEIQRHSRVTFWLLVVCANLPDIDVAQSWFDDYLNYVINHRGITHSILFAPVLATIPAFLFYRFSNFKNFKLLWLLAFIGILVHIFFDLITSFGTMLFAPFSNARYALDWMFIIDPYFTGLLALTLLFGKIMKSKAKMIVRSGTALAVLYLIAEIFSHNVAMNKINAAVTGEGVSAKYISALPQPLNIFRWNGLVQTNEGVKQAFFSVFDESLKFTNYENSAGETIERIGKLEDTKKYFTFARHPWLHAKEENGKQIVEIRDMQFTMDPTLLQRFGMDEAPPPFLMRYELSSEGRIQKVVFDGKIIPD